MRSNNPDSVNPIVVKKSSKVWALIIIAVVVITSFTAFLFEYFNRNDFVISPLGTEVPSQVIVKPFDKYRVLDLANYISNADNYVVEKTLEEKSEFISQLVSFNSDGKKITGMMNVPKGEGPFPVIVMFRGYVDPEIYYTGLGTQRAGEVFAKNGYITFAPDFLGYAGSDKEAENVFESRFQTYTTALDSLEIAKNIPNSISGQIGIWAHSNGGQITLTVLEATQKEYPAVLWAPVTKPFPYSILYYTDEAQDRGKFLRKELAKLEADYNVDEFSITDYVDRIKSPIQFHQGGTDEAVPIKWSNEFVEYTKDKDVEIDYFTYPQSDHNLMPDWNTVVNRNLEFYSKYLKSN